MQKPPNPTINIESYGTQFKLCLGIILSVWYKKEKQTGAVKMLIDEG